MQLNVFLAFWGAMTGRVRRIPKSLASVLAGTVVITGAVMGIAVVATLTILACLTLFTGMFSSPSTAAMAFQPYAEGPAHIDPGEAARTRRDILADGRNPLHCVASAGMISGAHPVMSLRESDGTAPELNGGAAVGEPIQVTDETAALLSSVEQVIATIPRGVEFFEAYAFVVTAVNGGVDSWQRFMSVTTQMHLGTPTNSAAAMNTARVFFTPKSDFSITEPLSAAVMLRLASNHVLNGEKQAGALMEEAVSRCA
jgi:hypothetical protein